MQDEPSPEGRAVRLLGYADLESVYDHPERVGRLAGLLAARRDGDTLVCGAGDDTALGTLAVLEGGGRDLARPFLAAVDPDVDTLGNHDLDLGPEWAARWARTAPPTYVCANVTGLPADLPDGVVRTVGGRRVALVGVAHPDGVSGGAADLTLEDPVAAVRRAASRLPAHDHLVVCSHWGTDEPLARGTDADVVLGGHVHGRWCRRVEGTLLVSPAGQGRELVEVGLGDGPPGVTVHDVTAERHPVAEPVATRYRECRAEHGVDEVLTRLAEPITRTEADRFAGESRAGNAIADAVRAATAADVGVVPAGSVRTGPPLEGAVTLGEAVSLAPFGGTLHSLSLDGAALRTVFRGAADPHEADRGWVHLHVSGARVRWDADGELTGLRVDGEPVTADGTYRLGTSAYLVETDHFPTLSRERVTDAHGSLVDGLVAHARAGGFQETAVEGRIRKAGTTPTVEDG